MFLLTHIGTMPDDNQFIIFHYRVAWYMKIQQLNFICGKREFENTSNRR